MVTNSDVEKLTKFVAMDIDMSEDGKELQAINIVVIDKGICIDNSRFFVQEDTFAEVWDELKKYIDNNVVVTFSPAVNAVLIKEMNKHECCSLVKDTLYIDSLLDIKRPEWLDRDFESVYYYLMNDDMHGNPDYGLDRAYAIGCMFNVLKGMSDYSEMEHPLCYDKMISFVCKTEEDKKRAESYAQAVARCGGDPIYAPEAADYIVVMGDDKLMWIARNSVTGDSILEKDVNPDVQIMTEGLFRVSMESRAIYHEGVEIACLNATISRQKVNAVNETTEQQKKDDDEKYSEEIEKKMPVKTRAWLWWLLAVLCPMVPFIDCIYLYLSEGLFDIRKYRGLVSDDVYKKYDEESIDVYIYNKHRYFELIVGSAMLMMVYVYFIGFYCGKGIL